MIRKEHPNLLCVSNKATASYTLKTSEGLIVIDAIYPKVEMFNAIIEGIKDIGWNPNDIKKFVITHGHFDANCKCKLDACMVEIS